MQLSTVWFLLIGFLFSGYAILDGFDLGAGAVHLLVARNDAERRQVLNAIGPVWDGNEVWLLDRRAAPCSPLSRSSTLRSSPGST